MSSCYPEFDGNSTYLGSLDLTALSNNSQDTWSILHEAARPLLAKTATFGAFSLLFLLSLYVLVRKGLRRAPNVIMLSAVVLLYAGATVDWVLPIISVAQNMVVLTSTTSYVVECLNAYASGTLCERHPNSGYALDDSRADVPVTGVPHEICVSSAVLAISMSLGDAIVLWRAWVLWKQKHIFSLISVALLLGSIAMTSLVTYYSCNPSSSSLFQPLLTQYHGSDLAALGLSLLANLWATVLIGYKAWRHRRLIKTYLRQGGTRTQLENIMVLFIESGVVYCLIWVFILADEVFDSNIAFGGHPPNTLAVRQFADARGTFLHGALVPVIGMYPTIVVVLVALEKSHLEKNFTYDRPVPMAPQIPLRQVTVSFNAQTETHDHYRSLRTEAGNAPFSTVGGAVHSSSLYASAEDKNNKEEVDVGFTKLDV